VSTVQEFDFSVDLLKAILWEHDSAPDLLVLANRKQDWYNTNQRDFWENWRRDVFDINTATAFGLSVWARILAVPLAVVIEDSRSKEALGFGTKHKNFNNGNFARGATGEQPLSVAQQRLVIKLRYFQLTSNGTVPEINEFLSILFENEGLVFVVDSLDMTFATYFFTFPPSSQLRFILEKYDLLPRPAGVGVQWQIQVRPSWGFGVNHLNFNNGNFGA
jgi:hypothetical protein